MDRFYRRVIKIRAVDSPNVAENLARVARGLKPVAPTVPGVLTYDEYLKRRATWDAVRQCVGLDAEFYEGASVLMFPPTWLDRAERIAQGIEPIQGKRPPPRLQRKARAVGIDPAEGGDSTAMAAVDEWGLIELDSKKTPDTNVIYGEALAFCRRWSCPWERVMIDRGGGGKQLADRMRANGMRVQTVAFGEPVAVELKRSRTFFEERVDVQESRYEAKNRRVEMYLDLRQLLDPALGGTFGLPCEYAELRRQLAPLPMLFDGEGRTYLPPKNKPTEGFTGRTLKDLIGCSPDEADALVCAVRGMLKKNVRPTAGAVS